MALDVVSHNGDPQVGDLVTPISGSGFTKALIQNLPAYRKGLSPIRRGLEVGMAHGYLLFGPFAFTSQFRNTSYGTLVGLIEAIILVTILSLCLSVYGNVTTKAPLASVAVSEVPAELGTKEGWSEFAGGFTIGGIGGAAFAYAVYSVVQSGVFQTFANGL
ncbi:MAG: photosystem I reaction center subunit XI [Limnothrix sp.]|jgi:photosystem I subunit 11|uniref:Photosystem I reaction center subunit XI n=1 Tax=Limnothrix redekei LRLZ20PSL1 TaxID=3112953 RepID=A0ABW7C5A0_9CYAN|nr:MULTISPECIES: photosystem I reaction center subunit XI [unclassified Limnothrix]MEB3116721.1 photosystem I reaction center subunit XI [Limnothrix sp.]OCQ94968.1 photosystem I reaction center protein subunit XI [Limnothrix sp. P13C2]RFP53704.1 MAG: photosystem I reaction center protein subunit XI [Limnothrix sp. CACIAM 69d]MBD2160847.1 photosystem I reaction center protein subunit XI [Limnothrix sp. FACHB-1083]MBD2191310.1 photosystem I reaction center protein subunit XI [Limnothrix sp. FACH